MELEVLDWITLEISKFGPVFPMNLGENSKLFYIISPMCVGVIG